MPMLFHKNADERGNVDAAARMSTARWLSVIRVSSRSYLLSFFPHGAFTVLLLLISA